MNPTDPLRVLVAHTPPVAFVEQNGNETTYSGFLVDLLPDLLRLGGINRTYEYVVMQEGSGGSMRPNGSWTGVMGYLTRQEVDFAAFPLTLTQQRAEDIDYTPAYFSDGYSILKKKDLSDSTFNTFITPFSGWTWLALLGAVIVISLVLSLLDKYMARLRRHTHDKLLVRKRVKRSHYHRHLFNSLVSFIGNGTEPQTSSWSLRILWATWLIFSVVFLNAYTANLTAGLTIAQLDQGVETLQQLKSSGDTFAVIAGSSIQAYFQTSVDTTARSMSSQMMPYAASNRSQAIEDVQHGVLGAYIGDYAQVQYYTQSKPCDLVVAKESFGPGQLVIGLPKNSPLTQPLTDAMLKTQEMGYTAEYRRKWLIEKSDCPQQEADAVDNSLDIKQVYSIFLLLAIGAGLSVMYALGECAYYRFFFEQVHWRRKEMVSQAMERSLQRQRKAILKKGGKVSSHGRAARWVGLWDRVHHVSSPSFLMREGAGAAASSRDPAAGAADLEAGQRGACGEVRGVEESSELQPTGSSHLGTDCSLGRVDGLDLYLASDSISSRSSSSRSSMEEPVAQLPPRR